MKAVTHIAEFITETSLSHIPHEAIVTAKKHILDCIGVTIAGSVEPIGKLTATFVAELGGSPKASVICGGFKTSAPLAAFANGIMAHALDYDDNSESFLGHPSAVLLPAILGLGEEREISGEDVLEAYLLGLEIQSKIGLATNLCDFDRGWHITGTLGALGAAASCAKILKLNVEQTRMAMGIAASSSSGLRGNFGTMTKPFHVGHASKSGTIAAMLASKGFTANKEILETRFGFLDVFCGSGKYQVDAINRLGHPFEIISRGLSIKQYPSCAGAHPSTDGILYLIKKYDIKADMVDSVECLVHPVNLQTLIHSDPKTGLEGKFSIQYCMAIAMLDRKVGLEQFTDEKVRDPKAQDLMKKVKMRGNPALEGERQYRPLHIVKMKLKDGREYSHQVEVPEGYPQNPLAYEKIVAKYHDCCKSVLRRDRVEKSIGIVERLERVSAINELLDLIRSPE